MEPEHFITLLQLNYQIHQAISDRFERRTYLLVADVTSHIFKAEKKIHYFELVEKVEKNSAITAKIMGKPWGQEAVKLSDFEKKAGQTFTNNLDVLVQVRMDYHALYGLSQCAGY